MSETNPNTIKIGRDEVIFEGEGLFILAATEMDWPVREFCRPPIYFRGRKYYLRTKHKAPAPHVIAYELWPWPADLHDQSPQSVVYDEAYVATRDFDARDEKKAAVWRTLLLPLFPFLGFFWSGFKDRVLTACGFNAISITRASVMLAFNFCILEGIFVGWLRGGLLMVTFSSPRLITLDYILLFVLGADSLMRASQLLLGEESYPYGLLEWLFKRKSRKNYS